MVSEGEYADAYAFGPQLSDDEMRRLRDGNEVRVPRDPGQRTRDVVDGVAGVRFAVWAPNASRVSVVGSFNAWDGRRHAMRLRHDAGVWELFVPHAAAGDLYKYELLDADGHLLPLKADPYARSTELRPETASVVATLPPPSVRCRPIAPRPRTAATRRSRSTKCMRKAGAKARTAASPAGKSWPTACPPTWRAWASRTSSCCRSPSTRSTARGATRPWACSRRAGALGRSEGFRALFVQACHDHGLGLLLDWVPAHFPTDAFGMARFDGTALYEYQDPKEGFHRDWNTLIYNFGRSEVRSFLASSALYWVERWGVDGLRVDAVASDAVPRLLAAPAASGCPTTRAGARTSRPSRCCKHVNEQVSEGAGRHHGGRRKSTSFPASASPPTLGGLGFHFKWNMGWMNDTLRYIHEDPVHRRYHHHKMTFGLVYAFSENFMLPISHDEVVHGKGSVVGQDAGRRVAAVRQHARLPGLSCGATPARSCCSWAKSGPSAANGTTTTGLPWHQLDDSSACTPACGRWVGDLNAAVPPAPRPCTAWTAMPQGFEWVASARRRAQRCYAWMRHDNAGRQRCWWCATSRPCRATATAWACASAHGAWREVLNSDSEHYGGSNVGNGPQAIACARPIPAHGRSQQRLP